MKRKEFLGIIILMLMLTGCVSNVKEGVNMLEEGRYEAAIEAFQLEIEDGKNLDEANRGMGIAYFELGKYADSLRYFEAALEEKVQETASLYYLMGTCCIQQKDYDGTISYYDLALGMEDCSDKARQEMMFNKIAIYEEQSDWDAAKKAVNAYLKLYPDDERVIREAEFLETR